MRISCIWSDDLSDGDRGTGTGKSDPYAHFKLLLDDAKRTTAIRRTETLHNAPSDVRFADVLELPMPKPLLTGFCKAELIVTVWHDDSVKEGSAGVSTSDLIRPTNLTTGTLT